MWKLTSTLVAAGLPIVFISPILEPAQEPDPANLDERFDAIARDALDNDEAEGLSIAIDIGGEAVFADGWGLAPTREAELANADTAYRAGALIVPFVAVAALRLADEDRIDLDASVTEYVGCLPWEPDLVTVEMLLAQSSGVPSYPDLRLASDEVENSVDPESVLSWLAEQPFDAEPGSCVVYSNTNTLLLGLIVERVSGKSVRGYLTDEFFDRLGMESTLFCFDGPALRDVDEGTQEFAGRMIDEHGVPLPFEAAGLCTSAADLVTWKRALLDGNLVSSKSLERMTTAGIDVHGDAGYGQGVSLGLLETHTAYTIGGSSYGCTSHLAHYPDLDLTIAVLANGEDADVRALERRIARVFFGLREPGFHDLEISGEDRARYVGTYYVGCSAYDIGELDERLTLSRPGGDPIPLAFQGDAYFIACDDLAIRLSFEFDESGIAQAFELEEHGITSRAVRLG